MSGERQLFLAYPGDLETRTGGYLYDRRVALELEGRGWQVERASLPTASPTRAQRSSQRLASDCPRCRRALWP